MSCLCPFGLQVSILLGILLLFVLVSCCSQFDFYLLSFSSAGSNFNSSKISPLLLWSKRVYRAVLLKNFICIDVSRFLSSFLRVQISHPHTRMGTSSALYTFILENSRTKVDLKVLFKIPSSWANFASFSDCNTIFVSIICVPSLGCENKFHTHIMELVKFYFCILWSSDFWTGYKKTSDYESDIQRILHHDIFL